MRITRVSFEKPRPTSRSYGVLLGGSKVHLIPLIGSRRSNQAGGQTAVMVLLIRWRNSAP